MRSGDFPQPAISILVVAFKNKEKDVYFKYISVLEKNIDMKC